jgi:hypothetical protein
MGHPAGRFSQLTVGVACLAIAWLPVAPVVSAAPTPPDAATALANSLRAIQDGENTAPRDHWDPKYVEAQLGKDPARTFAWVRDHTYWIPYHGILRGPVGVLMDRQGDSLDRALLLATMLKDEGQTVRLAHGTMPADQASRLVPSLLRARPVKAAAPAAPTTAPDPWSAVARKYQLDEVSLRKTITSQTEHVVQQQAVLTARLAAQVARLSAAVGQPPTDGAQANMNHAVAALADHWWVQTQDGATWRDRDLLGGAPGTAVVASDRTIDLAHVPADLYHQISIHVVAERWSNGVTSEKVVLEHTIRSSATIGVPISLSLTPGNWPKPFPPTGTTIAAAMRQAALDQHEWTPVLAIGDEHVIQNAITDSGDITMPSNQTDVLAVARGATHGLGGAINDVFGAPPQAPPPGTATGQFLTAVWLEYQISRPAEPPQRIRREVFDLRGPAARAAKSTAAPRVDEPARLERSLAMMMTTDILPVACEIPPAFVIHQTAQAVLANRALLTEIVSGTAGDDIAAAQALSARIKAAPSPLFALAVARFARAASPTRTFIDRPDVLSRHLYFGFDGARFVLNDATDIVVDGVGVDPLAPAPFAAQLAQGVLDTNVEAVLASDRPTASSAAWAFDDASRWLTLRSSTDSNLAMLRLPPDVRQRVVDALDAGQVVVAPTAPITVAGKPFSGWWQVDKVTGEALGMGETGWGAVLPEWALLSMTCGGAAFLGFDIACQAEGTFSGRQCLGMAAASGFLAAGGYLAGGLYGVGALVAAAVGGLIGAMNALGGNGGRRP